MSRTHFSKDIILENKDAVMIDIIVELDANDLLKTVEVVWTELRRGAGLFASGLHCQQTEDAEVSDTCFNNALDIAEHLMKAYEFEVRQ